MAKQEIYISMDVEADGPLPGFNSMLSFAAAAFDINKRVLGLFERNLELLDQAKPHDDTMKFWNSTPSNQAAYHSTRVNTIPASQAMPEFVQWLQTITDRPVFVGYPAVYDFKWIDWYCQVFTGDNPFGFSRAVDVKSMAWPLLKTASSQHCTKRNMPRKWFDKLPHTHIALDDAIEQGALFVNMARDALGLPLVAELTAQDVAQYRTKFIAP